MATPTRQHTQSEQASSGANPLQESLQRLAGSMTERAVSSVTGRLSGASERLTDYAQNGGGGLLSAVTGKDGLSLPVGKMLRAGAGGMAGKVKDSVTDTVKGATDSLGEALGLKGGKGGGKKIKLTNIVEQIDVGVPIDVAYRQWTQFADFPKFMKKVEQVEQISDEKLRWKAQVFWSHRSWESTIVEQVPNERIVWKSKGDKGYVDGAITFHEVTPGLTRVIVVLEYHPQGLFERTGNLWRAQGRRARLELKHFQRQVMTDTILHTDDLEGWQGEIRDGEVVSTGESDGEANDEANDEMGEDMSDEEQSDRRPRRRRSAAKGSDTQSSRPRATASASGRRGAGRAVRAGSGQRRTPVKKAARS
jgi:uncharacterized membrane protein